MQTLGKYVLEDRLGSGAFAVVWRARDTQLGRTVALKVLKPGWLDDEVALARFRQEARLACDLYHPHIAIVHEIGEAEGRFYIAMRYVDGASLDRLIRERGGLPWAEALRIVEQVASALDYAHGRGLVHRDVKPANIIVSPSDGAVLTDFGLARALDAAQSAGLTGSTGQVGTPYYRAPELWLGERKAGPPTPATDVYSLACVLAELLTGRVLFDGDSAAEVMQAHIMEAPPLPATWPPDVPAGVAGVLHRALAKQPGERTHRAGEFIAALSPHPPSPSPQAERGGTPPLHAVERGKGGEVLQLAPGITLELVRIPAGEFLMGSTEEQVAEVFAAAKKRFPDAKHEWFTAEKPQHRVTLAEYLIGKYPVTVAQFAAFVEATGYKTTAEQAGSGRVWTGSEWKEVQGASWRAPGGSPRDLKAIADHPVTQVSWHDARAFCEWASQVTGRAVRLPSEAGAAKPAAGPPDLPGGRDRRAGQARARRRRAEAG